MALSILVQVVAILALVVVVRDLRPNPKTDPAGWENIGVLVEFTSIASSVVLFIVAAFAGFYALDSALSAVDRATEFIGIFKLFGIGVGLVDGELVSFGLWKGTWGMFGAMAAVASLDLLLVFLVLRYLDTGGAERQSETDRRRPTV
ncbi:MAG: hypothetical protein ABI782_11165 [Anaerolineaceae bacterium]